MCSVNLVWVKAGEIKGLILNCYVSRDGDRVWLGNNGSQNVHLYQDTGFSFILVVFISNGFWLINVSKGEHF